MTWEAILVDEVAAWCEALLHVDGNTAEQVAAAVDLLAEHGPSLGRPLVDKAGWPANMTRRMESDGQEVD